MLSIVHQLIFFKSIFYSWSWSSVCGKTCGVNYKTFQEWKECEPSVLAEQFWHLWEEEQAILSIWMALQVPIQEALMKLGDSRKAADCQMQNRISFPDRAPTKILWPLEQRMDKPGSINDQGLQVWSNFSDLLNVPFWLKMQELGPLLHKVASSFYIQFLFLTFSVVFQLWQGQALKQGPENFVVSILAHRAHLDKMLNKMT